MNIYGYINMSSPTRKWVVTYKLVRVDDGRLLWQWRDSLMEAPPGYIYLKRLQSYNSHHLLRHPAVSMPYDESDLYAS